MKSRRSVRIKSKSRHFQTSMGSPDIVSMIIGRLCMCAAMADEPELASL